MAHKDKPNWRQILTGAEEAGSIAEYARALGKPRKTVCDWHKEAVKKKKKFEKNIKNEKFETKTYVITSAQIKTDVHEGFLKNLELFAELHDAEIMIPGITYNTNDGEWNGGMGDSKKKVQSSYFDARIRKYLMNDRIKLNSKFEVLGNMNILPTAVNPLSGHQTFTGECSAVFPHPKIALESVATRPGKLAKMLLTSGSVTVPNFIQKNAGIKGEFHHQLGAVVVEIVNEKQFHMRHILAEDDGSFYDLTDRFSEGLHSTGHRVESIVWGDIHHADLDAEVADANWWKEDSLSAILKPKNQFFHDLLDFKVRNHHNRDNPLFMKKMNGQSVKEEVRNTAKFLHDTKLPDCHSFVVKSNHDTAFDRWVNEVSHFDEPNLFNATYLLEMQHAIHKAAQEHRKIDLFEWQANVAFKKRLSHVTFLKQDESCVVGGVENGMHGDIGLNGARATPKSFTKIGIKVNSGHTHSCGIIEGVYTAGCCRTLFASYAKGPSSWSHTQIVQYANGKRTLLTCVNGKYYAGVVPPALLEVV